MGGVEMKEERKRRGGGRVEWRCLADAAGLAGGVRRRGLGDSCPGEKERPVKDRKGQTA